MVFSVYLVTKFLWSLMSMWIGIYLWIKQPIHLLFEIKITYF